MNYTDEDLLKLSCADKMPASVYVCWHCLCFFNVKTVHWLPSSLKSAAPLSITFLARCDWKLSMFCFGDEARIVQQNTTTRLWASTGARPRAVKQQQFEYAHLLGTICPANGASEALLVPFLTKEIMKKHLAQISATTAKGRYAVIVMDGAGWHTDDIADDFHNLSIIKLPPYSPELTPIEQVWSWLRQHHLGNRCFESCEAIVDACSDAWNDFISDTALVSKMCSRN